MNLTLNSYTNSIKQISALLFNLIPSKTIIDQSFSLGLDPNQAACDFINPYLTSIVDTIKPSVIFDKIVSKNKINEKIFLFSDHIYFKSFSVFVDENNDFFKLTVTTYSNFTFDLINNIDIISSIELAVITLMGESNTKH
jgi:hypothetical protein